LTNTRVYRNPDSLARAVADRFVSVSCDAADQRRAACIALSGGHTLRRLLKVLAAPNVSATIPWQNVRLYWVHERDASPEHPRSCYGIVRDFLLRHVPIPDSNVFPMRPWDYGVARAAEMYAEILKQTVPSAGAGLPRFDLALLGLGHDGDIAGLYPLSPGLHVTDRLCIGNIGPGRNMWVTLTYPVLNAASSVLVIASGASKADIVRRVLTEPRDIEHLPAQGIAPTSGDLLWMFDPEAAAGL
jgi:6-phosphogluconolactonase